jgi:hypothetical protein
MRTRQLLTMRRRRGAGRMIEMCRRLVGVVRPSVASLAWAPMSPSLPGHPPLPVRRSSAP